MAAQSYRGATSMARARFSRQWRSLRGSRDCVARPCRIRLHGCRELRPDAKIHRVKSSKTNDLVTPRFRGHESCIWSTNASPRLSPKGFSPNHGLDLVDHLGVPDGRLRGHAAHLLARSGAKGEGYRLTLSRRSVDTQLTHRHCAAGCPCPRMGVSTFLQAWTHRERQFVAKWRPPG